jgi:hypothetical protein
MRGERKGRATILILGLLSVIFWLSSAAAQEVKFQTHIKPIFDAKCLACHGSVTPEYEQFSAEKEKWLKQGMGMRMESFRHLAGFVVWPNTGALMRRLDDGKSAKDGKPGNMYEYLGSTDAERQQNLAAFKAWVGVWTLKRLPELTREELLELNKVREKY